MEISDKYKKLVEKYGEPTGEIDGFEDDCGSFHFSYQGEKFILTEDGDIIDEDKVVRVFIQDTNSVRTVKNIQWSIDMDEIYEKLDNMTSENAAEVLEIPVNKYQNMTTEERHDYAFDYFRHRYGAQCDFLCLPDSVQVAKHWALDDIADYLSATYGYCVEQFETEATVDEIEKPFDEER